MTRDPDDQHPSDGPDERRPEGPHSKLDEDAAWRSIVEHYGDRAELDEPPAETRFPSLGRRWDAPAEDSYPPADYVGAAEEEEHYVPPEPPPLPYVEPRRKLAWIGLFGAPVVMLAAVVFGWHYPQWFSGLLVGAFVGGFVYLVAMMPRTRHEDGPDGDDGAVV
jgi:hypothetical protein